MEHEMKSAYTIMRDSKNRYRSDHSKSLTPEAFKNYVLQDLYSEADIPSLKEAFDFANGECFLSDDEQDAFRNARLWLQRLQECLDAR